MQRRELLISASAGAAWAVSGCHPAATAEHITGGFTGIDLARGHHLRDALRAGKPWPAPTKVMRTEVVIAGGGVAGPFVGGGGGKDPKACGGGGVVGDRKSVV